MVNIVTNTILTTITGYLRLKSFRFRKVINSEPITLIKNGKIIDKNIKKSNLQSMI